MSENMGSPNSDDPKYRRLAEILNRISDRVETSDEVADLQSLLVDSEEMQRYYLEYLNVECLLADQKTASSSTASVPGILGSGLVDSIPISVGADVSTTRVSGNSSAVSLPVSDPSQLPGGARAGFAFSVSSALMLLMIGLLLSNLLWYLNSVNRQNQVSSGARLTTTLGEDSPQLVGVTACVWDSEISHLPGSSFGFGESLELLEGIAEFRIYNECGESAKVKIEGPASVFVRADGCLGLRSGLLTAKAVNSAYDFRIELPNGSLMFDGNSSVGVDARFAESRIHIFEGNARLMKDFSYQFDRRPMDIHQGESVLITKGKEGEFNIIRSSADQSSFASAQTMSSDHLDLGKEYRELVLKSNPAIYWRFDSQDRVRNEVDERFTAQLQGNVYWRRFADNHSPEFGLFSSGGSFKTEEQWPPKPLDNYSVELWYKPSHYHNGAVLSLCVPGTDLHGFLLEIGAPYHKYDYHTRPNRLRFLHRAPLGRHGGQSCYSEGEYRVRSWQHVVARKTGRHLELLVDGEVVAKSVDEKPLPAGMIVVLGQLYSHAIDRAFVGQLDEVALYDRALTDEEIQDRIQTASR